MGEVAVLLLVLTAWSLKVIFTVLLLSLALGICPIVFLPRRP